MEKENKQLNFDGLGIAYPKYINTYPLDKQEELYEYLKNMDEHHKKAYLIALNHLGSSFNIYKSNGFKDWKASLKN